MNEHGGNRRGEAETIDENMEDGATPEMKRKKAMYLNTTAEVKNGVESEGMITETAQVEERDRDKRRQRRRTWKTMARPQRRSWSISKLLGSLLTLAEGHLRTTSLK